MWVSDRIAYAGPALCGPAISYSRCVVQCGTVCWQRWVSGHIAYVDPALYGPACYLV